MLCSCQLAGLAHTLPTFLFQTTTFTCFGKLAMPERGDWLVQFSALGRGRGRGADPVPLLPGHTAQEQQVWAQSLPPATLGRGQPGRWDGGSLASWVLQGLLLSQWALPCPAHPLSQRPLPRGRHARLWSGQFLQAQLSLALGQASGFSELAHDTSISPYLSGSPVEQARCWRSPPFHSWGN